MNKPKFFMTFLALAYLKISDFFAADLVIYSRFPLRF